VTSQDAKAELEALPVSRETMARLELYAGLLEKWQKAVNLVAPSTVPELWQRHMLDSAQLWPLLPPETSRLVDLGSGAGFPGLVLAILGVPEVHLVESDQKKAAFLREAARLTAAPATIHNQRIEALAPFPVEVVTARALAPLPRLLELAAPFLGMGAIGLFLKGESAAEELTQARRQWTMKVTAQASRTSPQGVILRVESLRHDRSDLA
jgi:16S rRNA (guanine527-N7)-methyltransferase